VARRAHCESETSGASQAQSTVGGDKETCWKTASGDTGGKKTSY